MLVRVDFNLNVPFGGGSELLSDYRMRQSLRLVGQLTRLGCRVILLSHLGRPDGRYDPTLSLEPLAPLLSSVLDQEVTFLRSFGSTADVQAVRSSRPGSLFLMENLRFHPGEEAADPTFASGLAGLADCYINNAFSVSHRAHASVVRLPDFLPSYMGPGFLDEYRRVSDLVEQIQGPIVVLAGGRKVDKLITYRRLLPVVDTILVGSGFAPLLAEQPDLMAASPRAAVITPPDLLVKMPGGALGVVESIEVTPKTEAVDLGPWAVNLFADKIRNGGTIIINGAPGLLPLDHPQSSLSRVLRAVLRSKGLKVACGGTGCSLLIDGKLDWHVDHLFSGGGAILAFLAQHLHAPTGEVGWQLPGAQIAANKQ